MSFAPNETAPVIFAEDCALQSALLTAVAYGVALTLYCMCAHTLIQQIRGDGEARKWSAFYLAYSTVLFILGTLCIASTAEFTQLAFVQNRNFPGGPSAYQEVESSIPIDNLGNISGLIEIWLADALMVWRCYVIFKSCFIPIWITLALPCLLYAASFVSGVFLAMQESTPTLSIWAASGVNMTVPFIALSITFNAFTTLMIVGRLGYFRYSAKRYLGGQHGSMYTTLGSIVVESSMIYLAFYLAVLISFELNSSTSLIFSQVVTQIQIISPLLILFRVAQGRAWTQNTGKTVLSTFQARSTETNHINLRNTVGSSGTTQVAVATFQSTTDGDWKPGQSVMSLHNPDHC